MGLFIEKLPLGVKIFIIHPLKKQLPTRFGILLSCSSFVSLNENAPRSCVLLSAYHFISRNIEHAQPCRAPTFCTHDQVIKTHFGGRGGLRDKILKWNAVSLTHHRLNRYDKNKSFGWVGNLSYHKHPLRCFSLGGYANFSSLIKYKQNITRM